MRILHFPPPGKCSFAKIAEHLNNQADLKKQMVSGETRNQKIKRIQNLVDELKEQLSEKE